MMLFLVPSLTSVPLQRSRYDVKLVESGETVRLKRENMLERSA